MSRAARIRLIRIGVLIFAGALAISACGARAQLPLTQEKTAVTPATPTPPPSPTATPTPLPPSPTPVPAAAFVNGEMITLAEYQAELARYQAASQQAGLTTGDGASQTVIDDLINQVLLAQSANEDGFSVDEAQVETRLKDLAEKMGGEQALNDWMANNGYTQETLRIALARSIAAAWERDQIISKVPESAEQVHARQILLRTKAEADQVHADLESGKEFAQLADVVDPVAGGELGWFPRGYLEQPAVEEAAFALQPGEYSPVVETPLGFHIIEVLERESDRPLDPDARLVLQQKALQEWIDSRRNQSEIKITLP